jgi:hypothetical protein
MVSSADRRMRKVRSNKSLERTAVHPGRTVRALAVCARAGAEQQSWPAAQLGR